MSHAEDDPNMIFKFEGGNGGFEVRSKSQLNRSHDVNDSGNIRETGASDKVGNLAT